MNKDATIKKIILDFFVRTLPFLFVSTIFFLGGIVLLYLKIPGWSLFLGLPAVQMGIVALIFSLEKISKQKQTKPDKDYHYVSCLLCKHQIIVPEFMEKTICDGCQVKLAQNFKKSLVVLYLLFTIPMAVLLVQRNKQIRTNVVYFLEPTSSCEKGIWYPSECRCGLWQENSCLNNQKARLCGDKKYCCMEKKENVWFCENK